MVCCALAPPSPASEQHSSCPGTNLASLGPTLSVCEWGGGGQSGMDNTAVFPAGVQTHIHTCANGDLEFRSIDQWINDPS